MRRPTRRDLLIVVGQLQDLIGQAEAEHANDRSPDGFERGQEALRLAHDLCVRARSFDPPVSGKSRKGWGQ